MTKTLITTLALISLALPALACAQEAHRAPPRPSHPLHVTAHPRTAGVPAHGPVAHAPATHDGAHATPPRPPRAAGPVEGQVNLNTATVEDLMRIPGIGPVKAQAILATRARQPNGRFFRLEDVLRVHGIGRTTLRRLRDVLVLTGPTTLHAAPAAVGPTARDDDGDTTPREAARVRSDDDM